jgi:hypothetical protein
MHVLHYTTLGKPWGMDMRRLEDSFKGVHHHFQQQFRDWRESAVKVCPQVHKKKKNPRPNEDPYEWHHPVNSV